MADRRNDGDHDGDHDGDTANTATTATPSVGARHIGVWLRGRRARAVRIVEERPDGALAVMDAAGKLYIASAGSVSTLRQAPTPDTLPAHAAQAWRDAAGWAAKEAAERAALRARAMAEEAAERELARALLGAGDGGAGC